MYAWSILAAVATYAAAANSGTDTDTTTDPTTYSSAGPTVINDTDTDATVDLMTTNVSIKPSSDDKDVPRVVVLSGAAATSQQFGNGLNDLSMPAAWSCVTTGASSPAYECYGAETSYAAPDAIILTAKLRLADKLPWDQGMAMTAVERRLEDIRGSADESCDINIKVDITTGKGIEESGKSTAAFCAAFNVRYEDVSADGTAWSVTMTYKETLADATEAETKLTALGEAMKSVDMNASVSADKPYSKTGQFELAAEEPEKPSDGGDDKPDDGGDDKPDDGGDDKPDDGGDEDKSGAASLAVVAGAAISAATFLF